MMFALILLIFTFGSISAPPFSQEIKNCDSSGPRVSGLSLDSALTTFLCYTDKEYEAMGELEKKQKLAQKIAPMLRYEHSYGDLVKELVFMKSDTLVKLVNVIMNTENAQTELKSIDEYIATIHRFILKPSQDSELVNPHLVSLINSNVGEPGRKGRGAFWNKLLSMIGLNKDLYVKVPASDKSDTFGKASTAGEGSTASPASSSVATSTDASTVALTTASPTSAATTATTMATVTTLAASTVSTIAATTTTMTTTATTVATTTATTTATVTTKVATSATTVAATTVTTVATTTGTTVATTTATTVATTTVTTVATTTATTVATTTVTTVATTTVTTVATTTVTTVATTTASTVAATTASTAASTTATASTTVTTIAATTASTAVTSTVAITTTAASATTTASCLQYSPQVEATIDGAIGSQRSFDSATVEVSTSDKPTVTSEGECCSACQAKAADTNLYNFNPNQNICFCKRSICGTSPKTKFSQVQSAGTCPKI